MSLERDEEIAAREEEVIVYHAGNKKIKEPVIAHDLIAGIAAFRPAIELQKSNYPDPCGKCGAPNSVTKAGWFCKACMDDLEIHTDVWLTRKDSKSIL